MPSASQMFFEQVGLTRWGREPDFVAPKPKSAREIRKLGDALDEAERAVSAMWAADRGTYTFSPDCVPFAEFERIMKGYHDAKCAYGQAVTARNLYQVCKLENSKRMPKSDDKHALDDAKYAAEARIDELEELGPDFYTHREFIDANAAFTLADQRFDIAEAKYQSEEAASRRRDAAYRAALGSHSRLVTDGYVKTGKFKMIDGERIPVLEKIE
jgi:hypothetical protein